MFWIFGALGALLLVLIGGIAAFVYYPDNDPYAGNRHKRDYL